MHRFKELDVWKLSIELCTEVYKMTESFPRKEQFGLVSQINRCSVSIPSNIAEGAGRNSKKEFNNFLAISLGSAFELETQLIIATNLNYINQIDQTQLIIKLNRVQNMLYGLKKSLS